MALPSLRPERKLRGYDLVPQMTLARPLGLAQSRDTGLSALMWHSHEMRHELSAVAVTPHMSLMASRRGKKHRSPRKIEVGRLPALTGPRFPNRGSGAISAPPVLPLSQQEEDQGKHRRQEQQQQRQRRESSSGSSPPSSCGDLDDTHNPARAVDNVIDALEKSFQSKDESAEQSQLIAELRRARRVESSTTASNSKHAIAAHWTIRRLRMEIARRDRELAVAKLSLAELRHRRSAEEKTSFAQRAQELAMLHEARRGELALHEGIERKESRLHDVEARVKRLEAEVAADVEREKEMQRLASEERHKLVAELERLKSERAGWQQKLEWSATAHKSAESRAHKLSTQLRALEIKRKEEQTVWEDEAELVTAVSNEMVAKANAAGEHALHTLASGRAAAAERQWRAQLALSRTETKAEEAAAEAQRLREQLQAAEAARRKAEEAKQRAEAETASSQAAAAEMLTEKGNEMRQKEDRAATAQQKHDAEERALFMAMQDELRRHEAVEAAARERVQKMEEECAQHIAEEQAAEMAATAALEKAEEIMHASEDERAQMQHTQTMLAAQLEEQAAQLKALQLEQEMRLQRISELENWQKEDAIKDQTEKQKAEQLERELAIKAIRLAELERRRQEEAIATQAEKDKELALQRQLDEMESWKKAHLTEDEENRRELERLRQISLQTEEEHAQEALEIQSLKETLARTAAEERKQQEELQVQLKRAEQEKQEQQAKLQVMEQEKKVVAGLTKKMLGYELSASGEIEAVDGLSADKKKHRPKQKRKQKQKNA